MTEMDTSSQNFMTALKIIQLIANEKAHYRLNNLLGDIFDIDFQGNELYWNFQKRLGYYCLGGSTSKFFA
jgi:hypothetical protein